MIRKHRFECPNCGWTGTVPVKGSSPLLWVVLLAMAWNGWLFHKAGLEFEALLSCVVALGGAWATSKLPRWLICPACKWKHPLDKNDRSV